MRPLIFLFLFAFASFFSAEASTSVISIQAERALSVHVYVNGKLYNAKPDRLVRISSQEGLYRLQIRAYHAPSRRWYTIDQEVRTERGLEYCFSINWDRSLGAKLLSRGKYPVYSKYYLNPSLYNRHQKS